MKKLSYYVCVLFLGFVLFSCSKEGPQGPAGERGERGEQGADGQAGKDGTSVLSGTADPKDSEGKNGEFYINTKSYEIYGTKKDNKWGTANSLLGAKGDKGDKGAKGDKGDKGAKGDKGDKGAKGDKGEAEYVLLSGS